MYPLVGAVWISGVVSGFVLLSRYQSIPGLAAEAPRELPASTAPARDAERFTLLVFAHPHCPCTRSTLSELARVMARCGERVAARVHFYSDPAFGAGWERSELWEQAASIPGVEVVADPLGEAAKRFGAHTSGQVLLYTPEGALVFAGGITPARGHEGDSLGSDTVAHIVHGELMETSETPVFGCELFDESQEDSP